MDELGKDGGVGGHRHTLADRAPPLATMHRLLHKVFHVKPEGGGVSMSRRPSIVDSDGDYPVATRLRPPAVLPKSGCDAARTGPSCLYPAEPARPGSPMATVDLARTPILAHLTFGDAGWVQRRI